MNLKMKGIFALFIVLLSLNASAAPSTLKISRDYKIIRDTTPVELSDTTLKVFEKVEIEASYPGGEKAWIRYLQLNLDAAVPTKKKAPAGVYTVIVQFIVDKDGNITEPKPLTNHGYGMEAEVVRVIKSAPNWKPAMQGGRKVKAYRKQPVTFQVEEEKKKKRNKDD